MLIKKPRKSSSLEKKESNLLESSVTNEAIINCIEGLQLCLFKLSAVEADSLGSEIMMAVTVNWLFAAVSYYIIHNLCHHNITPTLSQVVMSYSPLTRLASHTPHR